jgi:hypothetical protein
MSEPLGPPSLVDAYHLVRSQLEHEDAQINQRVIWLLMSHSFLFTAFAITVTNQTQVSGSTFHTFPLLVLIPCVAIFSSALVGMSVVAGITAMRELRRTFAAYAATSADTRLPPLHGRHIWRALGLVTPASLPLLFLCVWLFLLIRQFV